MAALSIEQRAPVELRLCAVFVGLVSIQSSFGSNDSFILVHALFLLMMRQLNIWSHYPCN